MVPGVVFSLFLISNTVLWAEGSSNHVNFITMLSLIGLWFLVSVPFTFFGSYLAFKKPVWFSQCLFFHGRAKAMPLHMPICLRLQRFVNSLPVNSEVASKPVCDLYLAQLHHFASFRFRKNHIHHPTHDCARKHMLAAPWPQILSSIPRVQTLVSHWPRQLRRLCGSIRFRAKSPSSLST